MIFSLPLLLALLLGVQDASRSRVIVLDDFDPLSGWKSIVSDGATLSVTHAQSASGRCMAMKFDLSGGAGYVIAEKEFDIDLPDDYQFTFDLRGETPANNFEFKVIDEHDNVHWIKKLNVTYPATWTKQKIKKRHLSFAWGPAAGKPLRRVRALQFVVSAGSGGRGTVWIDNFRFEPRAAEDSARAVAAIVSGGGSIDSRGTVLTSWMTGTLPDSVVIDFGYVKEVGGAVIEWDSVCYASAYDVMVSDDGKEWTTAYAVRRGKPGRAYLPWGEAEGRYLKLRVRDAGRSTAARIHRMEFREPSFSASPNDVYSRIAADHPPGYFPRAFLGRQSYWTVIGAAGDHSEALINEEGQIEVDRLRFSLEPFIWMNGRLITWNDVATRVSLLDGVLPIPEVTWTYNDSLVLTIEAVAAGDAGESVLGIRYTLDCLMPYVQGVFVVALRPFQVNPPWQFLNTQGGTARVESIEYRDGVIVADGISVIPLVTPAAFGASEFDQGDITSFLARGMLPPDQTVRDHFGHASAGLSYPFALRAGEKKAVTVAVPFHAWTRPHRFVFDTMLAATAAQWKRELSTVQFSLPPSAQAVVRTLQSNLAYILINRDGPGIQPGSRSYERSWIRDGSLTCAALLRLGHVREVREFIDWYARGQFPNGKIPCVIDARGPDPVPEHDSHGQFIYAVHQYFLFTNDTAWLKGKLDAVVRTVRYIQSLRAERKTERYRTGTPVERACYGLVPESISHEGYSDVPRHSYWDGFFVLRGLKDAVAITAALGEDGLSREFAAERDDFRKDLYASMRLAMHIAGIDYIPGCVELGDFDATSTTVGLLPAGELGLIPEPQLQRTFDKYFAFFRKRASEGTFVNYTPYELRTVGSFVLLGQKKRAEEVLEFMLKDRRPPEWNHWAEVVWHDPLTPKFIGDMPHTWVGSDFIRSVLTMFVYERERDSAHVLCAGIPDSWIQDPAGVAVNGIATYHGSIGFTAKADGRKVTVHVSGGFDAARHTLLCAAPLSGAVGAVRLNGRPVPVTPGGEVRLHSLPAIVEFTYR